MNGGLTEEEFNTEKEKILNNEKKDIKISFNTALVIIISFTLIICIGGLIWYFNLHKKEISDTENNSETVAQDKKNNTTSESISFTGIKSNYKNYNDVEQEILNYFDDDYLPFYTQDLQKYPNVFKNAKVRTYAIVLKVLKSTDEEFEVLVANWGPNSLGIEAGTKDVDVDSIKSSFEKELLIVSGKQLDKRLIAGSNIDLSGKYVDMENRTIDGKDYVIPRIEAINIGDLSEGYVDKYSYNTIKTVSEYIFGKDIKIAKVSKDDPIYKITLDNQSNSNFKSFDISSLYSSITYDEEDNNLNVNVQKRLYIGADFQHYIVTTCDSNTKHIYIEYFDRSLQKIWSREFDYNSKRIFLSPMDYTSSKMSVVVDNELYLLDLKTGENTIEPLTIGEKVEVVMMDSGIVLIGRDNIDTFVKVDYNGKILSKTNGNTKMEIEYASTQIVNNKLVVLLQGRNDEEGIYRGEKYVVLNNDGTIESETNDIPY